MKRLKTVGIMVVAALTSAACGGGGGGGGTTAPPPTGADDCTATAQKEFVLERMRDVYLWADRLPAAIDIADFATPEALLAELRSFSPGGVDRFSFIGSASEDAQFFGEGQFAGFGFSSRFEADNDLRFTRVFADSPAALAGFERGQRILEIDGRTIAEIQAAEGINAAFGPSEVGVTRLFLIRELDGSEFEVSVSKDVVTIDPVPQRRIIETNALRAGYMEMSQFISTAEGADGPLDRAFEEFEAAAVTDLVVDLRYNGGGLVRTAELLGDYLGWGAAPGDVFSRTLFNATNAARNDDELFEFVDAAPVLSRIVFIATGATASASELVINGMAPHVQVSVVGADTFGKPVGQTGEVLDECDVILRPVAFETVNALDEGGYFDGLPADCPAADDIRFPIGDLDDPSLQAALDVLLTGSCPAAVAAEKPAVPKYEYQTAPAPPWRSIDGFF
ncbi:S41 family peptidase [Lentisalinibacter sediminis]|uniref:S41 family peptidase n=1 Tax=Lentisalinibacter sediminis TaxID=2992237 RepID=UPI00386FD167